MFVCIVMIVVIVIMIILILVLIVDFLDSGFGIFEFVILRFFFFVKVNMISLRSILIVVVLKLR